MVPAAAIGVAAVAAGPTADGARPLQRQHVVVEPRPPPLPAATSRGRRRGRRRGGRREQRAGEQHGEAEEREREEETLLPAAPGPPRFHHPRAAVAWRMRSLASSCLTGSISLCPAANPSAAARLQVCNLKWWGWSSLENMPYMSSEVRLLY